MKTVITAVFLGLVTMQPASATDDLLRTFASCAGRLTAQLEVSLIHASQAPQRVVKVRAAVLDILDLVVTPSTARAAYDHRVWSRMAQAELLTRARKEDHPDHAAWAEARAASEIAQCEALVLG